LVVKLNTRNRGWIDRGHVVGKWPAAVNAVNPWFPLNAENNLIDSERTLLQGVGL